MNKLQMALLLLSQFNWYNLLLLSCLPTICRLFVSCPLTLRINYNLVDFLFYLRVWLRHRPAAMGRQSGAVPPNFCDPPNFVVPRKIWTYNKTKILPLKNVFFTLPKTSNLATGQLRHGVHMTGAVKRTQGYKTLSRNASQGRCCLATAFNTEKEQTPKQNTSSVYFLMTQSLFVALILSCKISVESMARNHVRWAQKINSRLRSEKKQPKLYGFIFVNQSALYKGKTFVTLPGALLCFCGGRHFKILHHCPLLAFVAEANQEALWCRWKQSPAWPAVLLRLKFFARRAECFAEICFFSLAAVFGESAGGVSCRVTHVFIFSASRFCTKFRAQLACVRLPDYTCQ